MQYCPQQQGLSLYEIALFFNIHVPVRGSQHVKVLQGKVGLADSEPPAFPIAEVDFTIAASALPWVYVVPIVAAQTFIGIEVGLVDVIERTIIIGDVVDVPCLRRHHIIGKIERTCGYRVMHAVVGILDEALELFE